MSEPMLSVSWGSEKFPPQGRYRLTPPSGAKCAPVTDHSRLVNPSRVMGWHCQHPDTDGRCQVLQLLPTLFAPDSLAQPSAQPPACAQSRFSRGGAEVTGRPSGSYGGVRLWRHLASNFFLFLAFERSRTCTN